MERIFNRQNNPIQPLTNAPHLISNHAFWCDYFKTYFSSLHFDIFIPGKGHINTIGTLDHFEWLGKAYLQE